MHWADVIAEQLEQIGTEHRIATGITPSGQIHVGNLREVMTGDLVYRALRERGMDAKLTWIADTIDPLRKRYPFLPASYDAHIGKGLYDIPCPCDEHASYADHYIEPFLAALEQLGIEPEMVKTHELYASGAYALTIERIMDNVDLVRSILERISKRQLPKRWYPYNPRCSACGRFTSATVTGAEYPFVEYRCECGHEGRADVRRADGKLPWRLDWPARWSFLNVTCEPFGKDHAAAGGSYDTGTAIIRDILGDEEPFPVVYEWIQLKIKGKVAPMSSSTGVVVSCNDMLDMVPAEVVRFLFARVNPDKHFDFDSGFGLLNLVEEYDRHHRIYFSDDDDEDSKDQRRIYELSQVALPPEDVVQVPYRHLVVLCQLEDEFDGVLAKLEQSGHIVRDELSGASLAALEHRVRTVRFWLRSFAPNNVLFSVQDAFPQAAVAKLSDEDRAVLGALAEALERCDWDAEAIHRTIYDTAEAHGHRAGRVFKGIYLSLLAQPRGPRAGAFLASLERAFVVERLRAAAAAAPDEC